MINQLSATLDLLLVLLQAKVIGAYLIRKKICYFLKISERHKKLCNSDLEKDLLFSQDFRKTQRTMQL
jgi:hypothetical protein